MDDKSRWEEVPPDPAATIESLRSLGYTPGSAIADLIDNSVTAEAGEVTVVAKWAGADSWLAILDNGHGMTENRLREAMRIGSSDPLDVRAERDLGRFGFGLKTASFSQAREVTVLSRRPTSRGWAVRAWDLDHVRRSGRWLLGKQCPDGVEPLVASLTLPDHGTVVLWRRLSILGAGDEGDDDAARRRDFNRHLDEIASHLGMVFARFLANGTLTMRIGRHRVTAWDPFLAAHQATQELPPERLLVRGHEVSVRPYVLPHTSKLTAKEVVQAGGPAGWNEQQGFYVYRKNRLVTAGDWLGLGLARDDLHNLARLAVDVPAEIDDAWRLDIRKALVRPPDALRGDLLRIARFTRQRAASVQRHRGTTVTRRSSGTVEPLWIQRARHGRTRLTINRSHPLVRHLLNVSRAEHWGLNDLLSVLEQTIPVLLLPSGPSDEAPLDDRPADDIVRLAEVVYETLLKSGLSRGEARQRLMNTEPFHLYPSLLEKFGGTR